MFHGERLDLGKVRLHMAHLANGGTGTSNTRSGPDTRFCSRSCAGCSPGASAEPLGDPVFPSSSEGERSRLEVCTVMVPIKKAQAITVQTRGPMSTPLPTTGPRPALPAGLEAAGARTAAFRGVSDLPCPQPQQHTVSPRTFCPQALS